MFDSKVRKVKKSDRGKNLRIGVRDLEVLRFILEMGQVSSEMIFERFYRYCEGEEKERKIKYVQNRISRLKGAEYIATHWTHDGPKKWLTATKKAKDMVLGKLGESGCSYKVYQKIRLNQFDHDKYIAQLRIMLELEDSEINWREEELINDASMKVIPDGVFNIGEELYYLEFENTHKSEKFVENKVASYLGFWGEKRKFNVLFVCMDKVTFNKYKRIYKKKVEKDFEYILKYMDEVDFSDRNIRELTQIRDRLNEAIDNISKPKFKFIMFEDLIELYKEKGRLEEKYLEGRLSSLSIEGFDKYMKAGKDIYSALKVHRDKIVNHEHYDGIVDHQKNEVTVADIDRAVLEYEEAQRIIQEEDSKKKKVLGIF